MQTAFNHKLPFRRVNRWSRKAKRARSKSLLPKLSPDDVEFARHWHDLFGSMSIPCAQRLLVRLKRLKQFRWVLEMQGPSKCKDLFKRRKFKDRNYHHLLPKSKGGKTKASNMLLVNIKKHQAWHKLFGLMNLEEVISTLGKLSANRKTCSSCFS